MCDLSFCQGSWKEALRNSFKNFRRNHTPKTSPFPNSEEPSTSGPPTKKRKKDVSAASTADHEDVDYSAAVIELGHEWKKGKKKRNLSTIKDLLTKTERGTQCR